MRKVSVILLVIALGICCGAQTKAGASSVARGKYLVARVGVCGDCHSPRDQKGMLIQGKELSGSALMFQPTVPVPNWVMAAPDLRGLPGWDEKDAVKFLMTGVGAGGKRANPPMPEIRLSKQDASAVVAYLKSLSPTK